MSSKIFRSIWVTAISVFLASLIFIMGISYSYFSSVQKNQLKIETELASRGVSLSGGEYFADLNTEDYRITWIDAEGKVLYDSEADSEVMENHLEREEVREALETGYGEAVRYSNTLAEREMYYAKKLADGSVLRLSTVQAAVWTLVLGFAQPICLVILIALGLSFLFASRLTKKIVNPINEIDLGHPELYYGDKEYKEVEPLLKHIISQRQQLKKDRNEIEKTSLIRQEFTANVSHELKTPLHAISGYAELLENGMVKEEDIPQFAGKIRGESLRLSKLVENIIDLTKLDESTEETEKEDCDLYRIAKNAVESLEPEASAMDISMEVEGGETHVKGVPQMLYSIVYNLCDNAIKYNHEGGSVTVSVSGNEMNALIKVKDTGIGIPDDSKDRIFERFYRIDKSRSKETGGTGLGLSIVKHAVLIHGGKIEVSSAPGEGAEILVTIPREPVR